MLEIIKQFCDYYLFVSFRFNWSGFWWAEIL